VDDTEPLFHVSVAFLKKRCKQKCVNQTQYNTSEMRG